MLNYTEENRKNDFHWFLENYDSFYQRYGVSYLAIQNHIILGVYNGMREAIDETSKQYPLGSFIVQFCNGDESAYTASIVTIGVIG